jgi:hypothetical protein
MPKLLRRCLRISVFLLIANNASPAFGNTIVACRFFLTNFDMSTYRNYNIYETPFL